MSDSDGGDGTATPRSDSTRPTEVQLVRSLTESTEAMDSLAQALIPGIIAGLSTYKSLLVEKVTSRDAHAPLDRRYYDTRTYALTRTDTRDPVPSNAAGSASQNSNAAGVSHNSNAAGPSNAAQWNNLPPLTGYPWPMPGFPTPPMWGSYPPVHSGPESSSASQQSSSRLPEASSASDSESEIDPFVREDEREDLLGDLDSEEDREDPSDDDGPPPSKKIKLSSPKTVSLLQAVMEKPLKNERRKKFTAKFPLPSCDEAHTPKLDDTIACIVPKSAKTYDRFLSKLQQFSLDALGPMIWLYDQMSSEQGVDATKAKAAVESSITLLGNAAIHFSTERRKCLMKHLNKDLRPLCEGKFPNRGAYLFGDNFGSKAK